MKTYIRGFGTLQVKSSKSTAAAFRCAQTFSMFLTLSLFLWFKLVKYYLGTNVQGRKSSQDEFGQISADLWSSSKTVGKPEVSLTDINTHVRTPQEVIKELLTLLKVDAIPRNSHQFFMKTACK